MNVAPDLARAVRGRIDGEGRLVEADPLLAQLQARAGGRMAGPIAIPQLALVVRLAQRLGITVSRGIVAADGEEDLNLWVRAAPDRRGGVTLAVLGWADAPARAPAPAPAAERAADFARAAADWVWKTDEQLRFVSLSPEAAAAIGAAGADLIGQPLTHLFALEPAADGAMPLLEAMGQARPFARQPAKLRGGDRSLALAGTPLRDEEGRFAGFTGTATIEAAPGADRAPGLGATLGQALRAPLDRIIAAADAIRSASEGPLREDYVGYAGDIAGAGRHMLALVGDLVDLQAIEHPGFRLASERFDLADCARRAGGLLGPRAAERGVRIVLPDADAELFAQGEPRRALQVLVNLIGNAVRYSPPEATVEVSIGVEAGRAFVAVADRGKGIDPADQARIFEKFERVDPGEPGGTGLGLYIARRLARAMGGDVTVQSAAGEGARFTLSLRVADAASAAA